MPVADLAGRLEFAVAAAREAGRLTLDYFGRGNFEVESKADASPVTVADRGAEQLLRRRIAEAYADDAVLGEEFGESPGSSGFRWILDPIDGTQSFVRGVPLYGTLVGLEREGRSHAGVIYAPALDECVYAAVGQGAWYTRGAAAPVPARVSATPQLAGALFLTSNVAGFAQRNAMDLYVRLQSAARVSRTWGDCYGYLMVATGRADVMVDPQMNVWDAAALQPVLEEAGGTYTDWRGTPTIFGGEGLATNGHLLAETLAVMGMAGQNPEARGQQL
jgi:histidinol phosphatase-like enzyme (inositol monophosphatase family)